MNIDPTTGAVAANPDVAALVDAELAQLAADGAALRANLVEDAVVTARVLPSNGLTDLLEIAGRRVAAALPPNVRPGDVLQVRVNGFDGERILVQIVSSGPAAPAPAPVAPQPGIFVPGSIVPAPVLTQSPAPPAAAATPALPDGNAAPPPVAATPASGLPAPAANDRAAQSAAAAPDVARAAGASAGATSDPVASTSERVEVEIPAVQIATAVRGFGASIVGAATTPAGLPRATGVPPAQPSTIEARVAAANAALASRATAPSTTRTTAVPGVPLPVAESAVPAVPMSSRTAPPIPAQRFAVPPQIAPKSAPTGPAAAGANAASAGVASAANAAAAPAPARASGLAAFAQPVALLRALRLPVTPSNVASANLALQHPDRVPAALAALERALPHAGSDPNVATLKTLLGFVGRIDPRSPALAAQVAAYVDHVVDGAEPKLTTLLAAARAIDADAPHSAAAAPSPGTQHAAAVPPVAAALVAERSVALSANLKHAMLAVAANPATPESAGPALAGALTALTAVQLGAANLLVANPGGLAFTIPLATQHGAANAHITVQRDARRDRPGALDGENFRIAFVLDTAHYGTVAIELVTVGREVTVDVRTEAAPAMRAFRGALRTLTARLESLRYRVASADASLGTPETVAVAASAPSPPPDPDVNVDRSA